MDLSTNPGVQTTFYDYIGNKYTGNICTWNTLNTWNTLLSLCAADREVIKVKVCTFSEKLIFGEFRRKCICTYLEKNIFAKEKIIIWTKMNKCKDIMIKMSQFCNKPNSLTFKSYYAQFSLQILGYSCYIFHTFAI